MGPRTATILYGYDSSSAVRDTSSFENHVSGALYISSSFVRYRLKYKVTEPFGPHHEPLKVIISSSNQEYESQYTWYTGSTDDINSDSGILDEQGRLVTNYTSSWLNKAFGSGSHEISASFSTTTTDLNTTLKLFNKLKDLITGTNDKSERKYGDPKDNKCLLHLFQLTNNYIIVYNIY